MSANHFKPHTQEMFPFQDLSPENTDILEITLPNRTVRDQSYEAAIRASSVYKLADDILSMVERRNMNAEIKTGLVLGATAMVAMCRLVNPSLIHNKPMIAEEFKELLHRDPHHALEYMSRLGSTFVHDFHNTASVIRAVSQQEGESTSAAYAGAATIHRLGIIQHKHLALPHE